MVSGFRILRADWLVGDRRCLYLIGSWPAGQAGNRAQAAGGVGVAKSFGQS